MTDSLPGAMQPILCCLGERVAGKPTQFLWERAIAAKELDWRAITIQLSANDLPIALDGMRVMRFMGLRFFPSLQKEAARLLAADTEDIRFIGSVTSAARTAESWQVWHHWGGAILSTVTLPSAPTPIVYWLHGDSVRCRSFYVALSKSERPLSGKEVILPSRQWLIWSDPPIDVPFNWLEGSGVEYISIDTGPSDDDSTGDSTGDSPNRGSDDPGDDDKGQQGTASIDPLHRSLNHVRSLMHSGGLPSMVLIGDQLPKFSSDQLSSVATQGLVAGGEEACRQAGKWLLPAWKILPEIEQIVACEAYDFQRWTGHSVAIHLLRDAYDEYNGF